MKNVLPDFSQIKQHIFRIQGFLFLNQMESEAADIIFEVNELEVTLFVVSSGGFI
jgi:hypothetical protein